MARTHHQLKEMFSGRRNIFTVLLTLAGGYFVVYPVSRWTLEKIGTGRTILIGLAVLLIGDYLSDVFHKRDLKKKR